MAQLKVPRIGIHLSDKIYVPYVKSFVQVKAFQTREYSCVVHTDCEGFDQEYQYHYILYVYRRDGNGVPCFAVSSSTNSFVQKMKNTGEGLSSIYTLGVFPCDGKTQHANYGLSDDWADLEKFTAKALSLFQERFNVSETPTEVPLVDKKRIAFVKERQKAWWEFWKK